MPQISLDCLVMSIYRLIIRSFALDRPNGTCGTKPVSVQVLLLDTNCLGTLRISP